VNSSDLRKFQLRADSIRTRYQYRLFIAARRNGKKAAEAAEIAEQARAKLKDLGPAADEENKALLEKEIRETEKQAEKAARKAAKAAAKAQLAAEEAETQGALPGNKEEDPSDSA